MNRLQLREKARRKLDETSPAFYSEDSLNDYINQGYRYYWQWMIEAQHRTCLKTASLNIVSGTAEIALPSDFVTARLVERVFSDRTKPLVYFERFDREADLTTSASGNNYLPRYSFLGSDLVLEPTPQEAVTGGIKLTYFYTPDEMDDDTDSPLIPSIYHDLLVTYAVVEAKQMEEAVGQGGADMAPFLMTLNKQEQAFKESIEKNTIQRDYVQNFGMY